jgi:hypothetical protein
LKDLLPKLTSTEDPTVSSTSTLSNKYGITADVIVGKFTSSTDGSLLDAKYYGFKKDGFWWVMWFYQAPALGTLDGIFPDEMFGTWQFTK